MQFMFNPKAGCITRGQWWLGQLALFIILIVGIGVIWAGHDEGQGPFSSPVIALLVLLMYVNFCVCANRLRDSGRSRWWYLAFLLPKVGTGLMLYFCGCEKGEENHKGTDYEDVFGGTPSSNTAIRSAQSSSGSFANADAMIAQRLAERAAGLAGAKPAPQPAPRQRAPMRRPVGSAPNGPIFGGSRARST